MRNIIILCMFIIGTCNVSNAFSQSENVSITNNKVKQARKKGGQTYTGCAMADRMVRKAAREKTREQMNEKGISTFAEYGKSCANSVLSQVGTSKAKQKLIQSKNSDAYLLRVRNTQ